MPHIELLDQITIDKIAAGEVIERPASVVKELVENAIDAGSTAVTVEIEEGGISLIRITDNGCGIAKQDVENAFLRHSTSKIRSAEGRTDHEDKRRRIWNQIYYRGRKRKNAGGDRCAEWNDLSGASAVFQYTCQTQIPEDADDRGKPYQ